MLKRCCAWFVVLPLFFASSCSTMFPVFEEPTINLTAVKLLERRGTEQRVQATFAVSNPNAYALSLASIDYRVGVNGYEVAKGVISEIPRIASGATETVNIVAGIDLISSFQLAAQLLGSANPDLRYTLQAGVDTGLPLVGVVQLSDSGVVALSK